MHFAFGFIAWPLFLSTVKCGVVLSKPTSTPQPQDIEIGPVITEQSSQSIATDQPIETGQSSQSDHLVGPEQAAQPNPQYGSQSEIQPLSIECTGPLPRFDYFAWQWGYSRTGQIATLTFRDFESLTELCESSYMRWAYKELVDYCIAHCTDNWRPPGRYIEIEPHLTQLEQYHDLWYRIRTSNEPAQWAIECDPNEILEYEWPGGAGGKHAADKYKKDYKTLEDICPEHYRPAFSPGARWGLGCECFDEGKPPICPRDNANWPITEQYGSIRTPLRHPKASVTRINPWEYDSYIIIQEAFVPACEEHCKCRRKTSDNVQKLRDVTVALDASLPPGWFTTRGAATFQNKVQKSYGAFETGCSSNKDCGRKKKCVAQPVSSTLVRGVSSTIAYQAVCVALTQSIQNSRLGGRDLHLGQPQAELSHMDSTLCPCNASYVSQSCCDSGDGMVYEDMRMRRGYLMF